MQNLQTLREVQVDGLSVALRVPDEERRGLKRRGPAPVRRRFDKD